MTIGYTMDRRYAPLGPLTPVLDELVTRNGLVAKSWLFYDQRGRCIAVVHADLPSFDANGAPVSP